MLKLHCLLAVFLVLVLAQSTSAWWWKRRDCPQLPHCPMTCASGYVSSTDYHGCTKRLCKCKDVCEHFNCPADTRCQKKFHCKKWGGCSVYPTCVAVLVLSPKKGLNADTTNAPTTTTTTTTTTVPTTTKPIDRQQVETDFPVKVITQKTSAPSLCQSGGQPLPRRRCGAGVFGSNPCPESYQCEILGRGSSFCCPIPETTTTTQVPTTTPPLMTATRQVESNTRKPLTSTLCRDGKPHLAGWYCGRGGEPCPSSHKCLIHPADRYAVCCPIPVPDDEPTQVPVSQRRLPMCEQPVKVGLCKASLPRWHFNSKTGECEFFRYGGCEGNANNFRSLESCQKACGKPGVSYCSLPPVVGRCRAAFHRFYYDSASGACKEFTYGGCEGNGNNFVSPAQCEQFCRPKTIYI